LVELRMSEHTGGRTGQESLLDKVVAVLNLLEDAKAKLAEKLRQRGINEIDLVIATLFNENHELLTKDNFEKGRLTSLVNYVMEQKHVWGCLETLSKYGYSLCNGLPLEEPKIRSELSENRNICVQKSGDARFRVRLKILFGNEFFEEVTGKRLETLLEESSDVFADDVWLFYAVAINELKVCAQFGKTNVMRIYETFKGSDIFERFSKEVYENNCLSMGECVERLSSLVEECADKFVEICRKNGEELRLLETNDLVANLEYLKQLCICALALYVEIDIKKDPEFKNCVWCGEDSIKRSARSSHV